MTDRGRCFHGRAVSGGESGIWAVGEAESAGASGIDGVVGGGVTGSVSVEGGQEFGSEDGSWAGAVLSGARGAREGVQVTR